MKRFLLFTAFTIILGTQLNAQDTVRVMAYNILNYSGTGTYANRYLALREIIAYAKPDIFICSEMTDNAGVQLLLDSAFNASGIYPYSRVTFIDGPDTDNMLYYNNSKIHFKQQNQITTALRNITRYRLYYLISSTDTAWMDLFSCHLKASTGYEADRLAEAKNLCNFLGTINTQQNIIVGGDMNLYTSTEPAFQWMTSTNCDQQLYDPINRSGNWNNNATFKDIHTQSTRTATEPDGGSTGGLDDRFDIMLTNNNVYNGYQKVRYVYNSYNAIGNDANHFNLALTAAPVNTVVPVSVANALYTMSDHLPIMLDLAIGDQVGLNESLTNTIGITVNTITSYSNQLVIDVFANEDYTLNTSVVDVTGKIIYSENINFAKGQNQKTLNNVSFDSGIYLLSFKIKTGMYITKFFVN